MVSGFTTFVFKSYYIYGQFYYGYDGWYYIYGFYDIYGLNQLVAKPLLRMALSMFI